MSSIISNQVPIKCKDLECPTISIVIGHHNINRALLDLGASVKLLPFTVYERLGLGELKPTKMILQLADRSTRLPIGMVKDVLIKVGEFLFPMDFVVLKTEGVLCIENEIPVILARPFLATLNALINCRDGKLKLTFGKMTMELNVFNIQKQPMSFNNVDHQSFNWVSDLCLLYTSPSPRDGLLSRMPSSA